MNPFNLMKQFKNLQDNLNRFKEELENELITYEDENCRIVATVVGEVKEIEIKTENCKDLSEKLLKAFKEVHKLSKERIKEKAKDNLFGGFGIF
jgi:DNA-binding protein YbaB